jgi:predicted metal-dependent HD superfamily phosphohydrolase
VTEPELRRRFYGLWRRLRLDRKRRMEAFDRLFFLYSEPHRHYHVLAHVADCLHEFRVRGRRYAANPDYVEMAIWYHDAVYNPKASDNEARSADLMVNTLGEAGASHTLVIRQCIEATRHREEPSGPDEAVMVDVDLSVLGRPPDEFDRYERAIRAEFAWIPEDLFRRERAKILRRFLARTRTGYLYRTPSFRRKYETQARENLARSLVRLERRTA